MILIVTHFQDITVVRLTKHLRARGVDPLIADSAAMEAGMLCLTPAGGSCDIHLHLNGQRIPLSEIHSAWLWRPWERFPEEPHLKVLAQNEREWSFYRREWMAFHRGFSMALAHSAVFCVNPPPNNIAFEEKICQLMLAARIGLNIPETLYTTRPATALPLYDKHCAGIIYKPFSQLAYLIENGADSTVARLYTNRVSRRDLESSSSVVPTPSIFQPYIAKAIELRIVIVGRAIFACAIHSQASERSRDDWRRYDFDKTPYEIFHLPADIKEKLLLLMDRLGLVFGSVDMILTPGGDYVFLEINPNGQFDWIVARTELPVYEALADLLITRGEPDCASG